MMIEFLRKLLSPQPRIQGPGMLNSQVEGDVPNKSSEILGTLKLHSGKLSLGDPQYVPGLTLSGIPQQQVNIRASVWRYPSGTVLVACLYLEFDDHKSGGLCRKLGEVGIDSAKLVILDRLDFDQHWQEIGLDRIGVIGTLQGDQVLNLLKKKFNLKISRVNGFGAELIEPVSQALEHDILELLNSIPKYAKFPFMHFFVHTNNSFERANSMDQAWGFIPVGSADGPLMFVSDTGHSDGTYDVLGEYDGDALNRIVISFVD